MAEELRRQLQAMPIVAILPNLPPSQAAAVAYALVASGVRIIEVPLRGADVPAALRLLHTSQATPRVRAHSDYLPSCPFQAYLVKKNSFQGYDAVLCAAS